MPRSSRTALVRSAGAAVALTTALAGCSDLYLDRRQSISFDGSDAVMSNRIVQTIDPWPPAAADRRHVFDDDKMRSAAVRYRTGKIIQPVNVGTTATWKIQQSQTGGATDTDIGAAASKKGP